jgi:hypothetical protein
MAVTINRTLSNYGQIKVVATFTADGTVDFTLPRVFAATFEVISAITDDFGGGTLELQAAPDAINYAALPTPKTLTSENGIKSVAPEDLSFYNYRLNLSGSTTPPTITVTLIASQIP